MPCAQAILANSKCWVQHMQLNQTTGLDPEGVMLRASEGLAAVDFLMPRCALCVAAPFTRRYQASDESRG